MIVLNPHTVVKRFAAWYYFNMETREAEKQRLTARKSSAISLGIAIALLVFTLLSPGNVGAYLMAHPTERMVFALWSAFSAGWSLRRFLATWPEVEP